jgi:hypothetical protein
VSDLWRALCPVSAVHQTSAEAHGVADAGVREKEASRRMSRRRICKCGCGLPVLPRKWYAADCPNTQARADAQYRNLLACQQRRRKQLAGQERRTERLKDGAGRVRGDISEAEIEQKFQEAQAEQKYARRKAQAA